MSRMGRLAEGSALAANILFAGILCPLRRAAALRLTVGSASCSSARHRHEPAVPTLLRGGPGGAAPPWPQVCARDTGTFGPAASTRLTLVARLRPGLFDRR